MAIKLPKTAQAATDLVDELVKKKRWHELGSYFWAAFGTLKKGDKVREAFGKAWDSLTEEQKEIIEESV